MRDFDKLIEEVNDSIQEIRAAKEELRVRTAELVEQMKSEGKTREWAVGYMDLVCKMVDARTAAWSMSYFNQSWPKEES